MFQETLFSNSTKQQHVIKTNIQCFLIKLSYKQFTVFFIAELIIDVELEYDGPIKDYCGTCTKCIDACPTQAIVEPYVVDGSKCISYLTIELKEGLVEFLVP